MSINKSRILGNSRFVFFLLLLSCVGVSNVQGQASGKISIVPEPQKVDFSLSDAQNIPNDVQQQIAWFAGQFGGGGDCVEGIDTPISNWNWTTYDGGTKEIPVTVGDMIWCVQDHNVDNKFIKSLVGKITLPDSSAQSLSIIFSAPYISFTYHFGVGSQLGKYSIELTDGRKKWSDSFTITMPDAPTAHFNYDPNSFHLNNIWLLGFAPRERVRILVYNRESSNDPDFKQSSLSTSSLEPLIVKFLSERWFETDINGMLLINFKTLGEKYDPLVIISRNDSQIVSANTEWGNNFFGSVTDSIINACPKVLTPHLSIGITAQVNSFNNNLPLRIRESPGTSGKFLASIPNGTKVKILIGPSCIDGLWWWGIETSKGLTGWAAEGDDVDYYLLPLGRG